MADPGLFDLLNLGPGLVSASPGGNVVPAWRDLGDLSGATVGALTGGPTWVSASAAQRDVRSTFLVDVALALYDPVGQHRGQAISVEWSIGDQFGPGATWSSATPQPYDRRWGLQLPPNEGSSFEVALDAPGTAFTFVWDAFLDLPEGTYPSVWLRATAADHAGFSTTTDPFGPIVVVASRNLGPDPLAAQLARRRGVTGANLDFLGAGLLVPFRRGSRDFVSGSDVDLIRSCVRMILLTRAAHGGVAGELPWRPDFGSKLWTLKHRNNDRVLRARADAYVREALQWEPRVRVLEVSIQKDEATPNELHVSLVYEVISENVPGNRVELPTVTDSLVV